MVAEKPSAARQVGMVLAIGLALYGQLTVHRTSHSVTGWLALGVAALLAAVVAGRRDPTAPFTAGPAAVGSSNLVRVVLAAVAIAAIAATTYLSTYKQLPVLALLSWLASPVVATIALRGWIITPPRRAALPWTNTEIGLFAALLALAALARMLWLSTLPRTFFGDEPRVAMFLVEAYQNGVVPSFFTMGWNTWPVIGLSLQGLFAPLFGVHIWTLRLSSALMGTLGVMTTYLLARELFAPRAALLAAFLFAICRTAIDFSRLGIAHAQILCLEPLAFFCLWWALNSGRAVAYLWAGVVTGWCLYSYNAGQLVPPLIFGWLVLGALLRPSRIGTHWRGVALLAAAFALTLFPYLYYFTDAFAFTNNWGQWTIMARNRQTLGQVMDTWRSAGFAPAWDILSRQVWTTWLGFGVLPGSGYVLGYRQGGMLDDVSAALFVLGLGIAIRRIFRAGEAFMLYWWIATVLAGGIATIDPPSFVRMVGLLPVLALLAAQPLEWLLRSGIGGTRQLVASLIVVALLSGATWDNYRTYFVAFAANRSDPISELGRMMESLPPDHQVALLGVEHFLQFRGELFVIEFPGRFLDVAEPAHFLPIHEPMTQPLTLVLGPTQTTLGDYLRTLYPGVTITSEDGFEGEPVFYTALLTPDVAVQRTGLMLTIQRADGSTSEIGVADPFAEHVDVPADATRLIWTGSIYWPSDRPRPLNIDLAQPTTVKFGDAPPIAGDGTRPATGTITLRRGWQPVRIEETVVPRRQLSIEFGQAVPPNPITRWALRPEIAPQGLLATYTRNDGVIVNTIDPQLNAFAVEDRFLPENQPIAHMPFTATWRGALRVDTDGSYAFEAIGSGPYEVRLDGKQLFATAPSAPEQPALARGQRTLTAGLHPIAVDYDSTKPAHTTRRIFQLFWTPPGGNKQLIPPTNFVPNSNER